MRNIFTRKPEQPPVDTPITGESICAYLSFLNKEGRKRERLNDEIQNRGLSFGDLRVDSSFGVSVIFRTSYDKTGELELTGLRTLLEDVVREQNLESVAVEEHVSWNEILVVITTEDSPLRGIHSSGFSGGKSFSRKIFFKLRKIGGCSLEIEAFSPEAIDIAFLVARRLGLATEPATYAYESSTPIKEVVRYAYVWRDPETGNYFVEISYVEALVKHWVYIGGGWSNDYPNIPHGAETVVPQGVKTIVLASQHGKPKIRLNNVPVSVKPSPLSAPTSNMFAMRDYVRERSKRMCNNGCDQEATREFSTVRCEMGDDLGTSSFGSVVSVCDSEECETALREEHKKALRITATTPYLQEVW